MRTYLFLGLVSLTLCGSVAIAEKASMTAEENAEVATDIAVGTVAAIYTREQEIGDWHYVFHVAEIKVEKVEKGKGLSDKAPAYVRYWHRGWIGEGRVPPSTSGHRGLPGEGDQVRVYVARNAYDGFSFENKDGGFNVIGCDGFEILKKAEAEKPVPKASESGKPKVSVRAG